MQLSPTACPPGWIFPARTLNSLRTKPKENQLISLLLRGRDEMIILQLRSSEQQEQLLIRSPMGVDRCRDCSQV